MVFLYLCYYIGMETAIIIIVMILVAAYSVYFGFHLGAEHFYKVEIDDRKEEARQELEDIKNQHTEQLMQEAIALSSDHDFMEFLLIDYIANEVIASMPEDKRTDEEAIKIAQEIVEKIKKQKKPIFDKYYKKTMMAKAKEKINK